MKRSIIILCSTLGVTLAFAAGNDETAKKPPLRLLLSEVQAGAMASEQYCALVFDDHTFHYERASLKLGKDRDRRVFEGELVKADWDELTGVLDGSQFRDLTVPPTAPPVVVEDAHTFTISVSRGSKFQNMEFFDNSSRKPYESQLKPLMHWWKAFRGSRMQESRVQPDARCSLDNSQAIYAH